MKGKTMQVLASTSGAVFSEYLPGELVDLVEDEVETGIYLHDEEDEEEHTLLASARFTLVGIRFYKGTAHPGEYVTLIREPLNQYDRNAIRVDNQRNEKVGHIKKEQAALIAPYMDDPTLCLKVEGTIPEPGNAYVMPLHIDFYAISKSIEAENARNLPLKLAMDLKKTMKYRYGFHLSPSFAAALKPSSSGAQHAPIIPTVHSKTLNWETQSKELDDMFDKQLLEQLQNLPDIPMPPDLTVSLMDHQTIGTRWLVKQERGGSQHPFFKQVLEEGKSVWLCDITKCSQQQAPHRIRGSILADEMGLGKTLQTIALILANPPAAKKGNEKGRTLPFSDKEAARSDLDVRSVATVEGMKVADLKTLLQQVGLSCLGKKAVLVQRCLNALENGTLQKNLLPTGTSKARAKATGGTKPNVVGRKVGGGFCTLIVCPVSVMSNWKQQITSHVREGSLRLEIYQGAGRKNLLPALKKSEIDILLVSYHTLASEFSLIFRDDEYSEHRQQQVSRKRAKLESMFDIPFHRIVLDEAHTIRSTKTRFFRSVQKIQADHKLALTGSPFVNRADDIHSLLAFLEVEPLSDKGIFQRAISQPIKEGDAIGLTRLRVVMSHVALRRSKARCNIQLAEKEVQLRSIEFPNGDMHKQVYDALFGCLRVAFQAVLQDSKREAFQNYSSVLEQLLRMRQSCCSASLITPERRDVALSMWKELHEKHHDGALPALSAEEGLALLEKLKGTFSTKSTSNDSADAGSDLAECAVCLTEMEESTCVILRSCAHVYCEPCISRIVQSSNNCCPLCRKPFQVADMIYKQTAATAVAKAAAKKACDMAERDTNEDRFGLSPKVLALLEAIKTMQPDEKGVIFSQFTSFLNIIGTALEDAGHVFVRLDGSMSAAKRLEAISSFCSDEDNDDGKNPRFILCSLHAAGTGINLTRGNYAFMMDCWWNQAIENQAMDRIHRIGQSRKVQVIRFVMKDSIEERMVRLQEAKTIQAKGSMEKLKRDEQRKARLGDLKSLLLLET